MQELLLAMITKIDLLNKLEESQNVNEKIEINAKYPEKYRFKVKADKYIDNVVGVSYFPGELNLDKEDLIYLLNKYAPKLIDEMRAEMKNKILSMEKIINYSNKKEE